MMSKTRTVARRTAIAASLAIVAGTAIVAGGSRDSRRSTVSSSTPQRLLAGSRSCT